MARRAFSHLSLEEREHVSLGLVLGKSLRSLAVELGRSPSTVSREVSRNRGTRRYLASTAERTARARATVPRRPKKLVSRWLWRYVERHLRQEWSPQQIVWRLKRDYPGDMSKQVSHETIYAMLYTMPRGEMRRQLVSALRRKRKWRRHHRKPGDRRGQIPNMVSIHERPEEVMARQVPGHWEGDLVKGTNNQAAIGTLVERTTRLVLLVKMDGCTAETARKGFARKFRHVPEILRKSLTYDRGKEMTEHEELTRQVKIQVYFADPHSPWQRGLNENTNGLIRQYFPKGTDLTPVTQRELNFVANRLNTRPRRSLDCATPLEAWEELLGDAIGT